MRTETLRRRRGHNFYPPKTIASKVPALGATDNPDTDSDEAIVHLHYFSPTADWYVTEADFETGEAFGWAELLPGCGEWGYMSLPEMEGVYLHPFGIIERDLYWEPKPMRVVLKERAGR
jgi:hypothetical protein